MNNIFHLWKKILLLSIKNALKFNNTTLLIQYLKKGNKKDVAYYKKKENIEYIILLSGCFITNL